jgi:hypothetical protein
MFSAEFQRPEIPWYRQSFSINGVVQMGLGFPEEIDKAIPVIQGRLVYSDES